MLLGVRSRWAVAFVLASTFLALLSPGRAAAEDYPVVAGVVTDATGHPISDATLAVKTLTGSNVAYTTSATDGSFSLPVPPGQYRVFVTADAYVMRWLGGGEDMASGTVISVTSGTTDASLILQRGGVLRGTVSIDGAPISSGVTMRIDAIQRNDLALPASTSGWIEASASGDYAIPMETERPVVLQLEIYRDADGSGASLDYWYGDVYLMQDASSARVDAGDTTAGLDIDFPGFATLTGKLRNQFGAIMTGTVDGYVVLPTGQLVPTRQAAFARFDGYKLVVPADRVTVQGWWSGEEGWWWSYLGDHTDPALATTLDLSNGETRTGLDIRVEGHAKVVGSVSDHNGTAVEGATVEVLRGDEVVSSARTEENGAFDIEGVGATSINNFLYLRISGDGIKTYTQYFSPGYEGYTNLPPVGVSFEPDRLLSPTSPPTVDGVAAPGASLTAVPGGWNVEPARRQFDWFCNGAPTGLQGTHITLTADHASCDLTVRETAIRTGYQSGIATSVGIQVQELTTLDRAGIRGKPRVGRTLQALPPDYSLTPDDVTYRWLRDGHYLGFNQARRVVRTADIGHRLAVQVIGHLNGYTAAATSPTTRRVHK